MVDILTAVRTVDALIVQSPQEAATVAAERWTVVVLGTEVVRMSLLGVHNNQVSWHNTTMSCIIILLCTYDRSSLTATIACHWYSIITPNFFTTWMLTQWANVLAAYHNRAPNN
jgi:hypothetical protein